VEAHRPPCRLGGNALRSIARSCHPLVDDGSHGERTLVLKSAKRCRDLAWSQCTARRSDPRREIHPHSSELGGKFEPNPCAFC
jgi:hypothetical protein